MPKNWYMLALKGSLSRSMNYVTVPWGLYARETTQRRKAPMPMSLNCKKSLDFLMESQVLRKVREKPRQQKIRKKAIQSCSTLCKQEMDSDSKEMTDFFKVVQKRELKNYYTKYLAEERSCHICLCPDCGLPKKQINYPDLNIYCIGPGTIR